MLEAGKKYRTLDGEITEPLQEIGNFNPKLFAAKLPNNNSAYCWVDVGPEPFNGVIGIHYGDRLGGGLSLVSEYIEEYTPTGTEAQVCRDIAERQQLGIAKYGQSVSENPLSLKQRLQHAYEEALDLAIYLKRCIEEIEAKANQSSEDSIEKQLRAAYDALTATLPESIRKQFHSH